MSISEFFTEFGLSLEAMLGAIFVGLLVAMGVLIYNKHIPGRLVRYLMENGIHSPEQAVTLGACRLAGNPLLAISLREGGTLRKVVALLPDEEEGFDQKGRVLLKKARFYLPEENRSRAEITYNNNGTSVLTVLLAVVIFLLMLVIIAIVTPNLVQMLKNLLQSITSA